ncbi:AMP-dependent synthetase/ligase [Akanthomyces lecanii RCEF 1005]|uniref:AMP-dependent synthetase/ligase n=1 Tax=Akanthomyces lecanii RCEF 1005 TaxID=1081108 RepID=A0A168J160_CORDF|nr:AMP-dependent synthetase/ligase [Akanthomyces lecanii RCEF 1005]
MRSIDDHGGGGTRAVDICFGSSSQKTAPHTTGSIPDRGAECGNETKSEQGCQRQRSIPERDLEQLWRWNAVVPENIRRCMHDIISEQTRQRPQDVAIQSWDGSLTYSKLDALSSLLALHLRFRGVGTGVTVPLCFEKSMWAVVALLAVMKTGAAFSLTDPSQPNVRLRTIVEQTGANLIITSALQSSLGALIAAGGTVVALSQSTFDAPLQLSSDPLPGVASSSLMYVIFTSGSTGKPKGVSISHENYTSGAIPRAEAVGYKSTSRVFDFPSYAFDVSIDCMLCTLACGGKICIPSEQGRMNDLSGSIRRAKANMVHMTPSVARVLDSDIIPSLDVLGLGGEAVSSSDAASWRQYTSLIIAYGPSECTVGCTINNNLNLSTGIGKGVGGTTWLVNPDDHNILVPVGEIGELLIEGPVVGIGYLGEPAKTAEVFIEDPSWLTAGYASHPGRHGRLYKTGDLVRYESNSSGSIEFVGRKDQQVKLRGQRIELAEVEHHVQACLPTGITVAAEVVKPENGSSTLVAFLAEISSSIFEDEGGFVDPSHELSAALEAIATTLAARVPRYMIPAVFITLASMPSMVSGKIDRKKLREIGTGMPRSKLGTTRQDHGLQEEPRTGAEKKLACAWGHVLGPQSTIYKASNFFGLGGDSLRAMKLVAAAREQGLTLTVADIFSSPTLSIMADKAASISSQEREEIEPFSLLSEAWSEETARNDVALLCSIEPALVEDVYPCTPLQEALMALSTKIKEAYVAQRVVVLENLETAMKLIAAFDEASKSSPILRTRIVQVPGRGLVQVVVNGKLEYFIGTNVADYLVSDRDATMDLGSPLIRYAIIDSVDTNTISFVLTMHHALYDGWAMPLIVERINQAYEGKTLSRPAEFKHFIKYLLAKKEAKSEEYWRSQLQGTHRFQFPTLPHEGYQARADELLEEYVSLEDLPKFNATVATVIRGAWAIVASQYINSSDVVFGETLTGRNAPVLGAEEIEGPMITTVPVRLQVNPEAQVGEFLQSIQEQIIGQIPHEHFGLQHIRRLSHDAREACELRTGLVLHPSTDDNVAPIDTTLPASRLVPAGDDDAAQEALKFNTYPLMLVCSIDHKGFSVMASFDSRTVDKVLMQRVLAQFKCVAKKLTRETTSIIANMYSLFDADSIEFRDTLATAQQDPVLKAYEGASAAYVVRSEDSSRMVPAGAIGELALQTSQPKELQVLACSEWPELLRSSTVADKLYLTGKLAKYDAAGKIKIVGDKATASAPHAPVAKRLILSAISQRQHSLQALWSRVLRVPETEIGLEDNFFLLGGDSISAMKLASEARPEGIHLTVSQMFANKILVEMAAVMEYTEEVKDKGDEPNDFLAEPFALLDGISDLNAFLANDVVPQLENKAWTVTNVLPTRYLQQIAVRGTTEKPRFSARYELIFFDEKVNIPRLRRSCQDLIAHNEILRTVFVENGGRGYAAVLDSLTTPFEEYTYTDQTQDLSSFTKDICRADVEKPMPLGSSFVKWLYVSDPKSTVLRSCLVFRISHAQYDEICLPILLRQHSALYTQNKTLEPSAPFSSYVSRILNHAIPASVPYWKELLADSTITTLRPDIPLVDHRHFAIEQSLDISMRNREVTVASFPTAAWALCLARRQGLRDVLFGEVVSGRSIDFAGADIVTGPCWQYVPLRVRMDESWTGADLLAFVQRQHVESAEYEGISLEEIAELCSPGWEKQKSMTGDGQPEQWWFDTVMHQDVSHLASRENAEEEAENRHETLYLCEEPLREWKIQAFVHEGGNRMKLEIVTFRSWGGYAEKLLEDLVDVMEGLVKRPAEKLFAV